jgi:hypothetical protein
MMMNPGSNALLFVIALLVVGCTGEKTQENKTNDSLVQSHENETPYDYRNSYSEIKDLEPILQRFSLPENIAWVAIMDSLYEKDLSGIKDSVLINDVNSYDPIGMGWSDSYRIDSVFASSTLAAQGKTSYEAKNVIDYKPTAWIEGKPDHGVSQYHYVIQCWRKMSRSIRLRSLMAFRKVNHSIKKTAE